jgi:hypothetical protein
MSQGKRKRQKIGDIVAIPLGDGTFGFGRILKSPLVAFYDLRRSEIPALEDILHAHVSFIIFVMKRAKSDGKWQIIGNAPLEDSLLADPIFFKKDPISGSYSTYQSDSGIFLPATKEQCEGLECTAAWDACHIVDRLIDHFAGRPNQWVESMRP